MTPEIPLTPARLASGPCRESSTQSAWPELAALPSLSSRRLLRELSVLAPTPIPIAVVGPSGTGKTGIASGIHRASARRNAPLVMINLSVLGDALASSELYGHEAGAFTGARAKRHGRMRSAHGGTLVIDELTKAPEQVQYHLLDLLDGKPFYPVGSDREVHLDVRIVALTSTPLDVAAKNGALVPDLFERLRTTVVRVADLNSRPSDVMPVVHAALARWSPSFGFGQIPALSPELAEALAKARWPGNHRQVDGLVQRLLANAQGDSIITMAHLPAEDASVDRRGARERFLEDYRAGIATAHAGPSEAGKHYGVDRATIRRWIAENQVGEQGEPETT